MTLVCVCAADETFEIFVIDADLCACNHDLDIHPYIYIYIHIHTHMKGKWTEERVKFNIASG